MIQKQTNLLLGPRTAGLDNLRHYKGHTCVVERQAGLQLPFPTPQNPHVSKKYVHNDTLEENKSNPNFSTEAIIREKEFGKVTKDLFALITSNEF